MYAKRPDIKSRTYFLDAISDELTGITNGAPQTLHKITDEAAAFGIDRVDMAQDGTKVIFDYTPNWDPGLDVSVAYVPENEAWLILSAIRLQKGLKKLRVTDTGPYYGASSLEISVGDYEPVHYPLNTEVGQVAANLAVAEAVSMFLSE